ncbi:metal-dependent hydrolase [Candidatus Woesearchaeota archaeon]|nr:metal-dependent hydrolase [Candidatus Woesearchaeota archaeon]
MMFKTHLVFSLFIGLVLIKILNIENQILFLILLLFFSIFPDIDEKKSKISRKIRFLSFPINLIFRHRGFFHTIYIPLTLFLLLYIISEKILGIAVLTGYVSHLFLDSLTKSGVRIFKPFFKLRFYGFFKVGKFFDYFLSLLFLVIDIYLIINL